MKKPVIIFAAAVVAMLILTLTCYTGNAQSSPVQRGHIIFSKLQPWKP
jgi:hypothetical protein